MCTIVPRAPAPPSPLKSLLRGAARAPFCLGQSDRCAVEGASEVRRRCVFFAAVTGAEPGTPLVKVVRLNAIMGSLETIGTLERTASAYIRWIDLLDVLCRKFCPCCVLSSCSLSCSCFCFCPRSCCRCQNVHDIRHQDDS